MKTCDGCGVSARDEAKFCPQCGKLMSANADGVISWQIEIPLITNRFILQNVGLGLLILMASMFVLFGVIFGFANGIQGVGQGFLIALASGAFFALISVFTLLVVLGNKYQMEFRAGNEGIAIISRSGRAHAAHRLALIAGLLARNKAAAGAGLSGMASEISEVPWEKVKSFKLYPEKRVIAVHRRMLPPVYVYCTADNFKTVTEIIIRKSGK